MPAPRSRPRGGPFLAAFLLLSMSACDELSINAALVVNLSVDPSAASAGLHIRITLSNEGETEIAPLGERFTFVITDSQMREVRRLETSLASRLAPGGSVSANWDQKDTSGAQVPAGSYVARSWYNADGASRQSTRVFTIE